MTDSPRNQLERAYRLIQQDHLDEAIAILNPFVAKNPDNADAWWLLANAVSEPGEARRALDNVLRLNPANMQARDLLEKLEQEFPSYAPVGSFTDDSDLDEMFGTMPDDPFDTDRMPSFVSNEGAKAGAPRNFVDDPAAMRTGAKPMAAKSSRRSPLLPVLLALILIVVIGGAMAFFVTRPTVLAPSSSPTSVAAVLSPTALPDAATTEPTGQTSPTRPATVVVDMTATEPMTVTDAPTLATAEATEAVATTAATSAATVSLDDTLKTITDTFRAGGNADAEARVDSSSLGKTLFVRFCSKAGPDLAKAVNTARELLATPGATVKDQIQAIGLEIVNCTKTSQSLYKGVAAMQDVVAFVDKTIDAKKFRATWKSG